MIRAGRGFKGRNPTLRLGKRLHEANHKIWIGRLESLHRRSRTVKHLARTELVIDREVIRLPIGIVIVHELVRRSQFNYGLRINLLRRLNLGASVFRIRSSGRLRLARLRLSPRADRRYHQTRTHKENAENCHLIFRLVL